LASAIPLAALAGVLAIVSWNMAEKHEFAILLRASRGDAVVLLVTFLLVVFRDLTEGILVGFGIGALLFLHRMAHAVEIERPAFLANDDQADGSDAEGPDYDRSFAIDDDIVVFRITGAFFFGAVGEVAATLDRIGEHPKAYVLDLSGVPILDSTAAAMIAGFARDAQRHHAAVHVAGAQSAVRRLLMLHGARPPEVHFRTDLAHAIAAAGRGT
jgi:SulP family sulfate permease